MQRICIHQLVIYHRKFWPIASLFEWDKKKKKTPQSTLQFLHEWKKYQLQFVRWVTKLYKSVAQVWEKKIKQKNQL